MEDMREKYENFKETVRAQADIVRIISEYVPLKHKGGRYWGCCPFHGEKTPSFTVDGSKGLFHCFGCGAGGDVFNFIMKQENLSFPDALKFLANKLNIPVPERQKSAAEMAREKEAKAVYEANELAAKFYQSCLVNTQYGKGGLDYLANRGITRDIVDKFGLGMAPPDSNRLHKALEARGISEAVLLQAGLVNKGKSGGVYDKFRGRIMIPIRDARGRVVGFTGRILDKNASPAKYMNTGDTPYFHKGNLLFGLDTALKAIRTKKQAIVVEGHMDAISLHAAGVTWAVASMGTAFTEHQANLLKKIAPEVVFSFDSDAAGLNAAMRSVPIAAQAGLKNKVMQVPDGKDPDDFVRKHGREAYEKLVANAVSGLDFQINHTLAAYDITTLTGKVEAVAKVLPFIRTCKSDVEIDQRLRALARRLTIDEGVIQGEFRKLQGKRTEELFNPKIPIVTETGADSTQQAERHALFALITAPQLYTEETVGKISRLGGFTNTERQAIYTQYGQVDKQSGSALSSVLFEILPETTRAELATILQYDLPADGLAKVLADSLYQLHLAALEREYAKHSNLAEQQEKHGNENFLQELAECRRIKNEMKKLTLDYEQAENGK